MYSQDEAGNNGENGFQLSENLTRYLKNSQDVVFWLFFDLLKSVKK